MVSERVLSRGGTPMKSRDDEVDREFKKLKEWLFSGKDSRIEGENLDKQFKKLKAWLFAGKDSRIEEAKNEERAVNNLAEKEEMGIDGRVAVGIDVGTTEEIEEEDQEIRISYSTNLGKMKKKQDPDEEILSGEDNKIVKIVSAKDNIEKTEIAEMVVAGVGSCDVGVKAYWWKKGAAMGEEEMVERSQKIEVTEIEERKKMEGIDEEDGEEKQNEGVTKIEPEWTVGSLMTPAPVTEPLAKKLGLGQMRFLSRPEPEPGPTYSRITYNPLPEPNPPWTQSVCNSIHLKLELTLIFPSDQDCNTVAVKPGTIGHDNPPRWSADLGKPSWTAGHMMVEHKFPTTEGAEEVWETEAMESGVSQSTSLEKVKKNQGADEEVKMGEKNRADDRMTEKYGVDKEVQIGEGNKTDKRQLAAAKGQER